MESQETGELKLECRAPRHESNATHSGNVTLRLGPVAFQASAGGYRGEADESFSLTVQAAQAIKHRYDVHDDLLAALGASVDGVDDFCPFCDEVSWRSEGHGCAYVPMARAAIAKAKGAK